MDAQAVADGAEATKDKDVKRAQLNKKRRERRNFKRYGEAGKPVIDKVAKRVATNKKKREVRSIQTQAKHAAEAAKPRDAEDMKRVFKRKYERERYHIRKTAANFMDNGPRVRRRSKVAADVSPDV